MPTIYDNIEARLADGLRNALGGATSLDACVGYFNLRGWNRLSGSVDQLAADNACRLLVGMSVGPDDELRKHLEAEMTPSLAPGWLDHPLATERKVDTLRRFRDQLVFGIPSNQHEASLRKLVAQLRAGRLTIKLSVRESLHAKLYLVKRQDLITPTIGYLGSSNLTASGLSRNGELNIDVAEQDAARKLQAWFDARWDDEYSIDIGAELIEIIEASWASETLVSPYHVYLKMAWHLSEEARLGVTGFALPDQFRGLLYDYQEKAVAIAAQYLEKQGGVLIGDVVGLGKTLMATALARYREESYRDDTLIICPPNLRDMWEWHRERYGLRGRVLSNGKRCEELAGEFNRYRLVVIDESHTLRNRETTMYSNIKGYIDHNESKVVLLSATPYNMAYTDLASQLRLFVDADKDLGSRPEAAIRALGGEAAFARKHPSVHLRTLAAFEKSEEADDWRDLMRRFLVRRTRSFIKEHYAEVDEAGRSYLVGNDGVRSPFPERQPKTVKFDPDGTPYGRLLQDDIVERIRELTLPRYGLASFIDTDAAKRASTTDRRIVEDLTRAGPRLQGFTRTGLLKRLESSGDAFLRSIERHILKNEVFLHALEEGLPLPIGQQPLRDIRAIETESDTEFDEPDLVLDNPDTRSTDAFARAAKRQYDEWWTHDERRPAGRKGHRWISANLFTADLARWLRHDATLLREILEIGGDWSATTDPKLVALRELLTTRHPRDKVLVFTQFADTAGYLANALGAEIGPGFAAVTGQTGNPAAMARRFSPLSNKVTGPAVDELRVLVTTDVLSEGQNLQDAHIVVNYDLPWAIIRLIQRVGRVDRIGQQAPTILCYSFLPAEGIEQLIRLRARVDQRLDENAQVVGADERFFEDDVATTTRLVDLYNETSGSLDDDGGDGETDFASRALQVWTDATAGNPALARTIEAMQDVVHATKHHVPTTGGPAGALVFVRSGNGMDALAPIDGQGTIVSESPSDVFDAARCGPDEPALERTDSHFQLVAQGVSAALSSLANVGSGMGAATSVRQRAYARLTQYHNVAKGSVLTAEGIRQKLPRVTEAIMASTLLEPARDALNKELKASMTDEEFAHLAIDLFDAGRLVHAVDGASPRDARIKCSMGLRTD